MNEITMNKLNKKINYKDGKIFYISNKNYSSKIYQKLIKKGYKLSKNKAFYILKDDNKKEITRSISFLCLLYKLSIIMR